MDDRATKSAGGIEIPEQVQTTEEWGTVKALGPKCEHIESGDRVFIDAHTGTHITSGGQDFILLEEKRVKAREAREGES